MECSLLCLKCNLANRFFTKYSSLVWVIYSIRFRVCVCDLFNFWCKWFLLNGFLPCWNHSLILFIYLSIFYFVLMFWFLFIPKFFDSLCFTVFGPGAVRVRVFSSWKWVSDDHWSRGRKHLCLLNGCEQSKSILEWSFAYFSHPTFYLIFRHDNNSLVQIFCSMVLNFIVFYSTCYFNWNVRFW